MKNLKNKKYLSKYCSVECNNKTYCWRGLIVKLIIQRRGEYKKQFKYNLSIKHHIFYPLWDDILINWHDDVFFHYHHINETWLLTLKHFTITDQLFTVLFAYTFPFIYYNIDFWYSAPPANSDKQEREQIITLYTEGYLPHIQIQPTNQSISIAISTPNKLREYPHTLYERMLPTATTIYSSLYLSAHVAHQLTEMITSIKHPQALMPTINKLKLYLLQIQPFVMEWDALYGFLETHDLFIGRHSLNTLLTNAPLLLPSIVNNRIIGSDKMLLQVLHMLLNTRLRRQECVFPDTTTTLMGIVANYPLIYDTFHVVSPLIGTRLTAKSKQLYIKTLRNYKIGDKYLIDSPYWQDIKHIIDNTQVFPSQPNMSFTTKRVHHGFNKV